MRKIILTSVLVLYGFASMAWGVTGHRITGWVAEKYLNKKARKEIERILGQLSLAMASTWMDEVRSDSSYNYMEDWHWVTIPDGYSYDQTTKNPHGDIIETLERIIAELKSHKLGKTEEAERIKILIHLVGDLHQPLHVGVGTDRGGNDMRVTWFKNESNLHRVWDSDMIDDTKLSYTEFAASLERPDEAQLKSIQGATIKDWVQENMSYRKQVYDIGNGKLGYLYTYKNLHIVRKRLLEGGVRLAKILNDIYGK